MTYHSMYIFQTSRRSDSGYFKSSPLFELHCTDSRLLRCTVYRVILCVRYLADSRSDNAADAKRHLRPRQNQVCAFHAL